MSKLQTENLVGVVGKDTSDVLGNVVWYSVAKGLITPDELRNHLVISGVGEEWMPNPIRVVDAFRRATKFKKRVASNIPNQYINYMVREVYADKELAVRHLVAETVDQDGKRLDYNSEAGRLTLNKGDSTMTVEFEDGNEQAEFFVKEMQKNFEKFKGFYDSQAIRVMVAKILDSFAPIPLRNRGGIYFVPRKFEEQVNKFTKLCGLINEDSNGWKLPVVDTFEQRKMVSITLSSHIKELHNDCKSSLGKGLQKAQINDLLAQIEKVTNDFKEYEALINEEDIPKIKAEIIEVRKMMAQLMSEIKA